jgi:lipopolysaccharide/colanic/teichoic acid biosynthesis glycosyltransferase
MIKRLLDITFASIGLLLLLPVVLIVAILVRFKLGAPILFSQRRPGLHGHIFTMYKFRSMNEKKDEKGALLPDNVRLTRFGKILRSTSLDELPGLWSVLKGDMSLVGPRPLLVEYLPLYSAEQNRRHSVKPGITGWAQINGRNNISWQEKFEFDVWYVDNRSFWLDIKIIIATVRKVFFRADISAEGEVTMSKFHGNS